MAVFAQESESFEDNISFAEIDDEVHTPSTQDGHRARSGSRIAAFDERHLKGILSMRNAEEIAANVRTLLGHSIAVTPIKPKEKRPVRPGWQRETLTDGEMMQLFLEENYNIGIRNGAISGGLIDIDLDCPEAVEVARYLLPPTPFRYGRPRNPDSHYMYRTTERLPKTIRLKDHENKTIAEFRTDGTVTVAPGSTHPSGDVYEGCLDRPPATIGNIEELMQAFRQVTLGAVLRRHYPERGGRHEFALNVGANLARAGMLQGDVCKLIGAVAQAANDDEIEDRIRAVGSSYSAYASGRPCYGYNRLSMQLGASVAKNLLKLVGTQDLPPVPPLPASISAQNDDCEDLGLDERGTMRNTRQNVARLLCRGDWKGVLAYDLRAGALVFAKRPPITNPGTEFSAPITDDQVLQIGSQLDTAYGISFSTTNLNEGVRLACHEHDFDPVVDYFEAVAEKWDGIDRLTRFLAEYFSAEDNVYTRMIGVMWIISAVARTFEPGVQADHMVIAEGGQGIGKSSAFRALGGKYHSADPPEITQTKEVKQWLQGLLIAEFGEMDSMRKAEATAVKTMLTETTDRYRPSYGRLVEVRPRRAVFAATTNDSEYLKDPTGNRRVWPFHCETTIDVGKILRDRDQLWGEAVARYRRGELWYPTRPEQIALTEHEQNQRVESDDLTPKIVAVAEGLVGEKEGARMDRLVMELQRGDPGGNLPYNIKVRIGRSLLAHGWKRIFRRDGSKRVPAYLPPEAKK